MLSIYPCYQRLTELLAHQISSSPIWMSRPDYFMQHSLALIFPDFADGWNANNSINYKAKANKRNRGA